MNMYEYVLFKIKFIIIVVIVIMPTFKMSTSVENSLCYLQNCSLPPSCSRHKWSSMHCITV